MDYKEDSSSLPIIANLLPLIRLFDEGIIISNSIPILPLPPIDLLSLLPRLARTERSLMPSHEEIKNLLTEENKEIARLHFKTYINDDQINPNDHVLLAIIKLWIENEKLPSKDELTLCIFKYRCNCGLLDDIITSEEEYLGIIEHCVYNFGFVPTCDRIINLIQYKRLEHQYPDLTQLRNYEQNLISSSSQSYNYFQEEKKDKPVANLECLKSKLMGESLEDIICSLCTEKIEYKQNYYKLPPCGHKFHATEKDCLDDASIINWLKKNNTCPTCRGEIKINH
jgi:hypothetical protein